MGGWVWPPAWSLDGAYCELPAELAPAGPRLGWVEVFALLIRLAARWGGGGPPATWIRSRMCAVGCILSSRLVSGFARPA